MVTKVEKQKEMLTREQRQHLMVRIENKQNELTRRFGYEYAPKVPAEVVRARLLVKKWETAKEKTRLRLRSAMIKRAAVVKEQVLFETPAVALSIVKRFEASKTH